MIKQHAFYSKGAEPLYSSNIVLQDRPLIRSLINEAVEKPVTAVVANVGFGKTYAVSTLYETSDNAIIWLQLTKLDNIAARLWERLCYGIAQYNAALSSELMSIGFPESINMYHYIFGLISTAINKSKFSRCIIVFDDFHLIDEPVIIEMLRYVINSGMQGLSVVLISNGKIGLELAEFMEKGMLSSITQDDLRLSKQEISEYCNIHGVKADARTVENILNRTNGWPFAVYLLGLSLKSGIAPEQAVFTRELSDIFELIERDIYQPMRRDVRDFFLKISILESVSPALVRILAEASPGVMQEITCQYSSLLQFDSHSSSYRMMTLFREFLLERHNGMSDAEIAGLNVKAAKWYLEKDDKLKALSHFSAGGDYAAMFNIILEHTRRLPKETARFLIKLIDGAPPEAVDAMPVISVARLRLMVNNGKVPQAYDELSLLREKYEVLPDSPAKRETLGEIYILSGVMSLIYKTLDFAAYFTKADELLPNGSKVIDRNLALVGGASFITNRDLGPGSVRKMTEIMFKTMPHAVRVMRGCGAGLEYLVAAEADYMTGDMKNAEKNAYAALYKAQPEEQYDIEYMAHSILLRVATYQGDYRRASVERDAVGKYFKRSQTPDCGLLCDITVSGFYVPFGRCDRVSQWILEDSEKTKSLAPISVNRGQWVRARCMLHNGRYGELLGYLGQLDELYKAKNSLLGLIENSVMRSIACYYSGDHGAAFKSLYESYLISYENNIIMLHIEFGKWMRTLVRAAKSAENCPIPNEWLDLIYRKSSTYAKRLSVMGEAYKEAESGNKRRQMNLSKRERDVLTGLCQGLTREEIALTYNLSINTVKSMMPILYDKLGAANKMDAVRIASSYNLMSDFA